MPENIENQEIQEKAPVNNEEGGGKGNPPELDEITQYAESIADAAEKKAFLSTLKDGKFDRDAVKNLSRQYLAERRKLSRMNEMPESIEAYKEAYKPDSKFENLFNEENPGGEKIRKFFANLDKMSMETGLNADKNIALKNFLLNQFVEDNLIDTRTKEEKEAAEAERQESQTKILTDALGEGIDLQDVNSKIDSFIEDRAENNEGIRSVYETMKLTAAGKLELYSLMSQIYGKPVPVFKTSIGNSKKSLESEYNNPNTSRERRKEIAEELNKIEM